MVDNCVNCREMVQRWYDEVKNYDFDKGGPKSRSGPYKHFSQMIWANSAELGVGTAVSKRYGFITVARYRPSGNEGDFAEFIKNVPPEGGTRKFFSNQLITSYFTFIRVHQPDIADLFLSVKALLYAPAQHNTCWSCWPWTVRHLFQEHAQWRRFSITAERGVSKFNKKQTKSKWHTDRSTHGLGSTSRVRTDLVVQQKSWTAALLLLSANQHNIAVIAVKVVVGVGVYLALSLPLSTVISKLSVLFRVISDACGNDVCDTKFVELWTWANKFFLLKLSSKFPSVGGVRMECL